MKLRFVFCLIAFLSFACEEDPCAGVSCTNGGTCVEGVGTCECLAGFEGENCETNVILKFIGSYGADYGGCVNTAPEHRVNITQLSGESRLNIADLGDYACPGGEVNVIADISGDQINIPSQNIDCSGEIVYTFSGSGSISTSVISLTFSVRYETDGLERIDNCTATLTK
ncbi:MAG: calcium-binding EGF-like domain-containing protein [Bacteroidota bacterium]